MTQVENIEDCLELFIGLQASKVKFEPSVSDINFLQSVGKQVFRGIALTDRQHAVVKEKLFFYKDQFTKNNIDIELYLDILRMPLRQLDRSKWIKLVESPGNLVYQTADAGLWIAVRFIFSKKLITKFEPLKQIRSHQFDSEAKIHYFKFNEQNVYKIITALENSNFEIEDTIQDYYDKLKDMEKNKNNYVPGIYNFKLENLNQKTIDYMISTIGTPTKDNLAIFKDRQERLGLHHFDEYELEESLNMLTTLGKKIVNRTTKNVLIKPSKYNINSVMESLLELNRFPLLVVLPDNSPLDDLHKVHTSLKGFIDVGESSVLFRLDNDSNFEFNDYIKTHQLNAPLDKNVKVVYISNTKIPKPLIKSEWKESTVLLMSSRRVDSKFDAYIRESDLIIHYDNERSQFMRFQQGIEEL